MSFTLPLSTVLLTTAIICLNPFLGFDAKIVYVSNSKASLDNRYYVCGKFLELLPHEIGNRIFGTFLFNDDYYHSLDEVLKDSNMNGTYDKPIKQYYECMTGENYWSLFLLKKSIKCELQGEKFVTFIGESWKDERIFEEIKNYDYGNETIAKMVEECITPVM